jgi:glycosyltransferase involved in cell wall biosynthesis
MRLAVIETSSRGGLLHYAGQLADALALRGHDAELVAPRGHELVGRLRAARSRAVLTPPVRSFEARPGGRLGASGRRGGVAVRLARGWARLAWEAVRGGYDVVVLTCDVGLWLSAGGAIVLSSLPRRPLVALVCHNVRTYNRWEGDDLFEGSRLQLALERLMSRRLDLVFVHGEASKAEFEAIWPSVPLAVVPHGDERLFASDPPAPAVEERILFFGEWRKVKGLPVLMEAFDRLASRRPGACLTIAGAPAPGDADPDAVRAWARRHGDRVRVVDRYVPIDDVRALFAAARVVVAPYLVAYQSGVVALAMTMGRAVVASDVGDLGRAVVHGSTGLLVPAGDAEALASALERLLADAGEATRMGAAGRARALEESSGEVVAEAVEGALAAGLAA